MQTVDKVQISVRLKRESYEAVQRILEETGMTVNGYLGLLVDSLAMSEVKSFKDLMELIVMSVAGEAVKSGKLKKKPKG